MPVNYEYCSKIEEVIAQAELNAEAETVKKVCVAISNSAKRGMKDCGVASTPILDYVDFTVESIGLPEKFTLDISCWIGVDVDDQCLYAGVNQSPFGKLCVSGQCGVEKLTHAIIADLIEKLVDEMTKAAKNNGPLELFLKLVASLVIALFVMAGVVIFVEALKVATTGVIVLGAGLIAIAAAQRLQNLS
jgi:hypothetical protein